MPIKIMNKRRYWNASGYQVAIVAVENHWDGIEDSINGDWAAYIGATHDKQYEEETIEFVAKYGCKLRQEEARFFFPTIPKDFHYRP